MRSGPELGVVVAPAADEDVGPLGLAVGALGGTGRGGGGSGRREVTRSGGTVTPSAGVEQKSADGSVLRGGVKREVDSSAEHEDGDGGCGRGTSGTKRPRSAPAL